MPMTLGEFELSLNVKDLDVSLEFYRKLGFEMTFVSRDCKYAFVRNGQLNIGLYQDHFDSNLLTFFGGDVQALEKDFESKGISILEKAVIEPDNTLGLVVVDPDGNKVYFNSSKED